MLAETESNPTLSALARCRHTVLTRASEVLDGSSDCPPAHRADALPAVTGLLMTSLEELKVAEEELREQNALLGAARAAEDERLFHYRNLFLHSPLPVLITDLYATILETNLAASELFRREGRYLERKPMAALVEVGQRDAFRKQVSRLAADSMVTDWRLVLHRMGDTPVEVRATVSVVPLLGATSSGVLYWLFDTRTTTR